MSTVEDTRDVGATETCWVILRHRLEVVSCDELHSQGRLMWLRWALMRDEEASLARVDG